MSSERIKPKRIRRPVPAPVVMNITSLMDIMTILLVFMLKHFSGDALAAPGEKFTPAQSIAQKDMHGGRSMVAITRDMVLVDGEAVLRLDRGRITTDASEKEKAGEIVSVALLKSYETRLKTEKKGVSKQQLAKRSLLVLADRSTPYATLGAVLAAAQAAEFPGYELAVMGRE